MRGGFSTAKGLSIAAANAHAELFAAEIGLSAAIVGMAEMVRQRPVGWARDDLVYVEPSPVAGLGLFAKKPIAKDTTLGRYPGRIISPAAADAKLERVPHALEYLYGSQDQARN